MVLQPPLTMASARTLHRPEEQPLSGFRKVRLILGEILPGSFLCAGAATLGGLTGQAEPSFHIS